jgi:hypothetical protein
MAHTYTLQFQKIQISWALTWHDTKRHKAPHVHVQYKNQWAVFDFDGKCLAGEIGKRASRLTRDFIEERQQELHVA